MKIFSLLIICVFFSACSVSVQDSSRGAWPKSTNSQNAQVNPFKLELLDELYDGQKLFLKLKLEQLNTSNDFPVFLVVETYVNGELGADKYYLLKDLEFDHERAVILSVDAVEMSDYQLKLYWGEEARSYYSKIYTDLKSRLELAEIKVDKIQICKDECQYRYNLEILLKNNSEITIPEVTLLVNLVEDIDLAMNAEALPVFQQKIPLKGLNLSSKSTRKLNYVLVEPAELADMDLKVVVKLD